MIVLLNRTSTEPGTRTSSSIHKGML